MFWMAPSEQPAADPAKAVGALVVEPARPAGPVAGVEGPSRLQVLRSRGRARTLLAVLGPAFVAAIAYVDPGNVATNVQGGARYGYLLLWVVLLANVMAMPVQYLSAKVGVATGLNLPELCRSRLPRFVSRGLWFQAELVAMATDLAEVVGGAIALNLLFGVPLLSGGVITALVALGLLTVQTRGYRGFEVVIVGLFAVILLGFVYPLLRLGAPAGPVAAGLVPHLHGPDSLLLAAGIIGATVMPHVIYLHSALTQDRIPARDAGERRFLERVQRFDVALAMGAAGVINMVMLVVAASAFAGHAGHADTIAGAHQLLGQRAGEGAALAFALALLASGLAASSVGTYSGQVVMQGFLGRQIPLSVRRLLTMLPALVVLASGLDPTTALVYSQVMLSFGIPFALVPLVLLARRRDVMGDLTNRSWLTGLVTVIAAVIILLNVVLIGSLVVP